MYNKYTILITAENKERYISDTINSCLKQIGPDQLTIIIVYSFLSNEIYLKQLYLKSKNIIFLKVKYKKKYPTQDQLFKIETASKKIKNSWVLLLDGDDKFELNKIKKLKNLRLDKNYLYLNNHKKIINKNIIKSKEKIYKNLRLYKLLVNDWPDNINTSSIIAHSDLIKKFFSNSNPYKWKYLAVDSQIVLYFFYKKKFKFLDIFLTLKLENINNLDKTFSRLNKKIFWDRRIEQHKLTKLLSNRSNFIDLNFSKFFKLIFSFF